MNQMKRPTGAFLGVICFSLAICFIMQYMQEHLLNTNFIPSYLEMEQGAAGNKLSAWIMWILGDMTEANFYKSYLAGIGLIVGSLVAHYLYKKNSKHQGIAIAYGSGLWPWVLSASTVSLVLSNLIYGWNIADSGWFPTFVVFVSVPAATILVYGGGLKNLLTGAIAAVIIVVPLSRMFMVHICNNIGIPGVAGSVFGMWAGGVVCFEIYRLLPWMHLPSVPEPKPEEEAKAKLESEKRTETAHEKGVDAATKLEARAGAEIEQEAGKEIGPEQPVEYKHLHPSKFFVKRIVADFSEPCFAGNEIAGAGLLIGLFISWLLCPDLPVYGSGTLPTLLMAEFMTGAVAMYVYWDHWMERAWFPSFPSMVSVAPSVAWLYEGNVIVAILAAVFGGMICPAMTNFVLMKLPKHWPAVIGTTFSMTVGTVIIGMFIICIRGIVPGL